MSTSNFDITVNERLNDEYGLDTVFYLRDGFLTTTTDLPPTWFDFGSREVSSKPSTEPYVSFRQVAGTVRNAVIRGYQNVVKEENIALEFSIFRPKESSRSASNDIEDELDRVFLNWQAAGDGFQILPDTANPKRPLDIPASGDDIESIKQIQYRFFYRWS